MRVDPGPSILRALRSRTPEDELERDDRERSDNHDGVWSRVRRTADRTSCCTMLATSLVRSARQLMLCPCRYQPRHHRVAAGRLDLVSLQLDPELPGLKETLISTKDSWQGSTQLPSPNNCSSTWLLEKLTGDLTYALSPLANHLRRQVDHRRHRRDSVHCRRGAVPHWLSLQARLAHRRRRCRSFSFRWRRSPRATARCRWKKSQRTGGRIRTKAKTSCSTP